MSISTVTELAERLTRLAANSNADICLPVGDLRFVVKILDARLRFGQWDVYVAPERGYGGKWVSLDSLVAYNRDDHRRVSLTLTEQGATFSTTTSAPRAGCSSTPTRTPSTTAAG